MYLRSIEINNLKLMRSLRLDLTQEDGSPRPWTVLLAENGMCKTAILQAIALAASGPERANQLAEVTSFPDKRLEQPRVQIQAEFTDAATHHDDARTLHSTLSIEPGWSTFQGRSRWGDSADDAEDPLVQLRSTNAPGWFAMGLGVRRSLPKPLSSPRPDVPSLDRMTSLFDRGGIIGTDFIEHLRRRDDDRPPHTPKLQKVFVDLLAQALLGEPGLLPHIAAIERRGQGGIDDASRLIESHRFSLQSGGASPLKLPATWLSHGYQSTIAWVADLIGHALWDAGRPLSLDELRGLVLIDELDLHLHPTWQLHLIDTLRRTFKNIQFVVSTHSPMLLSGFRRHEIVLLQRTAEGHIEATQPQSSPALMTGSQLFEAFFGIHGLHPTELSRALTRYNFVASDPGRSDAEDAEVARLRALLQAAGEDPGWDPVPIEPDLQTPTEEA